jgi:transposase
MNLTPDIEPVIAGLRKLIEEQRVEEALQAIAQLVMDMRDKNNQLQLRLLKLLRERYGRKSEKISADQLSLFLDQLSEAVRGEDSKTDSLASEQLEKGELPQPKLQPHKGHGRRALPSHLPREEKIIPAPSADRNCQVCGEEKTCIGYERSEIIEFIPASFKVIELLREKLACAKGCEGVVVAPVADKVIEKGLPGPGLLSNLLVSKYRDALPLHRLKNIYARSGVEIGVSTLAGWVGGATEALSPLSRAIQKAALVSHVLQTDDTGLRVLDQDTARGSKLGHLWVYIGDKQWVWFQYTPNWESATAREVLKERSGWLQHDGYAGYGRLHKDENPAAIEVGCWAHARRKFVEALESGDKRAAAAISLIGELFEVERNAGEEGMSVDERLRRRQEISRPVLERLGKWIGDSYNQEPPKSKLAMAMGYAINRWTALSRFLEDGRLPLDNNVSERALRSVAIGRKNYLFAGSDQGAERAAIAYTIIGTCVLCGVEPWSYLRDVFEKLAAGWPNSRLAELLPPNWAKQHTSTQDPQTNRVEIVETNQAASA